MNDAARILPESRAAAKGATPAELIGAGSREVCGATSSETFAEKGTESFGAPILAMDQGDLTRCFAGALREEYGATRKAKHVVADAANSNVRAAENWLDGKNVPDLLHALRLAVTVPAWRAELRRILALDAALEPDVEQALTALVRRYPGLTRGGKP